MALITCPECKKQISEWSVSCSNCSYPLTREMVSKLKEEQEKEVKFVDSYAKQKTQTKISINEYLQKPRPVTGIIVFFVIMILVYIYNSHKSSNDSTKSVETVTQNEQPPVVTIEQLNEQLKQRLNREIASFEEPFIDIYNGGTVESLQVEIALFSVWANIIREGENNIDIENKKLANTLKNKVVARQVKEFPKLRKAYGKVIANKLWENNIYVSTTGPANTIINLTGGLFADNKNIAETQKILSEVLIQFRFKDVTYRWYKGADDYTYFNLETPKDSVVK